MARAELARQIAGVAALDEPVRRALYLYVAGRPGPVGRREAAAAVGVSWALAGFHLDRLAAEGLLEVSFQRLTERRGPGAGRPAKLYRRSERELSVSVPERRYLLAARLLAEVIATAGRPVAAVLRRVARGFGRTLGAQVRGSAGASARPSAVLARLEGALAEQGYEPVRERDGTVRLRNCPFHALAQDHRDLVCGMNLSLVGGIVGAAQARTVEAVLDPRPGMCCVALRPRRPGKAGGRRRSGRATGSRPAP